MHPCKNLFGLSLLALVSAARACDMCSAYVRPTEVEAPSALYSGFAEQFTRFGSLRVDGHEVENPTGQYLNSSLTQVVLGRSFLHDRFALQLNVPLIARTYKRPEGFEIEHGHVNGLGDVSLLANVLVFKKDALLKEVGFSKDGKQSVAVVGAPDLSLNVNLLAGLKLPTGDSSRIKEEFNEVEVEGAPESGIHGHDLTLGTGSYDALFGAQFFIRYKALFFQADSQFTLRGDGRHSYHFANEFSYGGGPGIYVVRKAAATVALQCEFSGEYKDTDRFQGNVAEDTGMTSLYVGPRLTVQMSRIGAELGFDLPVVLDNTSLQSVPDYRIRAAFTLHF